jgi:hypothetical protein
MHTEVALDEIEFHKNSVYTLFFICLAVYFLINTLLSVEIGLFVFRLDNV